jgi:ABC-2 type transport system permease protein
VTTIARLFVHELRVQQLLFWRSHEAAFFTFLLPIILLVLLGSVYGDNEIDGVDGSTYLVAGLIGYGVVSSAFAGLAINLVIRRESGVLKRVRGTPLPSWVYLAAEIVSTLITIGLMVLAQLLIGHYLLDSAWPASPGSFAAVVLLGGAAFAALGLAATGIVKSSEGSSAVINAIYLPMVFISGAFFAVDSLPGFLQAIAEVLPLTYLLDLIRDTFVDGETLADSPGALAALCAWGIAGLVVAATTFRWEPREA